MGGIWTSQNKIIPGLYCNFTTNAPLSITPGDRGTVVILQECTIGAKGDVYTITALENDWPELATSEDKLLAGFALDGANKVLVYNLGVTRDASAVNAALVALKTTKFDVLCYPYDTVETDDTIKASIEAWVTAMVEDEGVYIQAVLANYVADNDFCINVVQGLVKGTTTYTAAQVTAWVAGITAGATVYQSNTGKICTWADDVSPRMTKSEMEAAITAGKFIFKVNNVGAVSCVYDINSLTTVTVEKGKMFTKNRCIRCVSGINNDVVEVFESNYKGKINNNDTGRSLFKAALVDYFNELQRLQAIQNFEPDDVVISAGNDTDAAIVDIAVQFVDAIEKVYMTVNLS